MFDISRHWATAHSSPANINHLRRYGGGPCSHGGQAIEEPDKKLSVFPAARTLDVPYRQVALANSKKFQRGTPAKAGCSDLSGKSALTDTCTVAIRYPDKNQIGGLGYQNGYQASLRKPLAPQRFAVSKKFRVALFLLLATFCRKAGTQPVFCQRDKHKPETLSRKGYGKF